MCFGWSTSVPGPPGEGEGAATTESNNGCFSQGGSKNDDHIDVLFVFVERGTKIPAFFCESLG